MPPSDDEKALCQLIRDAMNEKGISVRALARTLDPERVESQRRKISKWLDDDKPTTPSAREARRLAAALGKPDDYFVRPRPRPVDRKVQQLEEELERTRSALAAYRARYGSL